MKNAECDGVEQAAAFAIPSHQWGERPAIAIVSNKIDEIQVKKYLQRKLPKWCLPEHIILMENLPKTSTGKIMKQRLRDEFQCLGDQRVVQN